MKLFFSPLIPFINRDKFSYPIITKDCSYLDRYNTWKDLIMGVHYPTTRLNSIIRGTKEECDWLSYYKYIFRDDKTYNDDFIMIGLLDLLIFPLLGKLAFILYNLITSGTLFYLLDLCFKLIDRYFNTGSQYVDGFIKFITFFSIILPLYSLEVGVFYFICELLPVLYLFEIIRNILGHIITFTIFCAQNTMNHQCYDRSWWTMFLSHALNNRMYTLQDLQNANLISEDMLYIDSSHHSLNRLDQYRHSIFGVDHHSIYVELDDELYEALQNHELTVEKLNNKLMQLVNNKLIRKDPEYDNFFLICKKARTDYLLYIVRNDIDINDFIECFQVVKKQDWLKLIFEPSTGLKLFQTIMDFPKENRDNLFQELKNAYSTKYEDISFSLFKSTVIIKETNQQFNMSNDNERGDFARFLIESINSKNNSCNYCFK